MATPSCLLLCGRLHFPKIVTAISSSMYASRTFHPPHLPNEEEEAIFSPLEMVSVARIRWEKGDVASDIVCKRQCSSLLRCLALEHGCHVVRKPRPREEAVWKFWQAAPVAPQPAHTFTRFQPSTSKLPQLMQGRQKQAVSVEPCPVAGP